MKKLLLLAVALASVNAFATRARVNALGNAPHLIDTQTVYRNPADIFFLNGDYATIESGNTNATSTTNGAEGMVVRSMGDSKLGLSLGHDSDNAIGLRQQAAVPAAIATQQNPIELTYGMKAGDAAFAGTLVYSNFKDKTAADQKENTLGLRGGMRMGPIDADLRLGLANEASSAAFGKFKGTMGIGARFGYQMDAILLVGDVALTGYKVENAGGTEISKVENQTYSVRASTTHKKDGSEFFYGAGLASAQSKDSATGVDSKATSFTLPVFMGLEVDASSWLTLRGSITQSVLINDQKVEAAGTTVVENSPGANNTRAAIGAGLKFNKITVDGSLEGVTGATQTQQINANNLLGQVGLTYMF